MVNLCANQYSVSMLCTSLSKTLRFNEDRRSARVVERAGVLRFGSSKRKRWIVTMRDRGKNRKQLQRGRNLSIEAIQTVQALKRAKKDDDSLEQVFDSKFKRLLKFDMMAVLRDLLRQNECDLALKVFEDVRKECWYKPQVLLYSNMISVLASNGFYKQVELVYKALKMECNLKPDFEGFNALLRTFVSMNNTELVIDCFYLMKATGCEPDRSTFRILINGLELEGETDFSASLRQEAQKYYGESLEFLKEEEEEMVASYK